MKKLSTIKTHLGQKAYEHDLDPAGHVVRTWRSIVPVNNYDRVQNGDNVHHERKYEILGNERYDHGGGRQNFGHEKQKHNQGEQDRDTQGHLLALVRGQVEHEYGEEADEHGGYDQVDRVEEGLASNAEVVDELNAIGLLRVGLDARRTYHVPGAAGQVVLQVDHGLLALYAHLLCVEGPRAEAHLAELLVEGKVAHVNGAGALVDGRRDPVDVWLVGLGVGVEEHVGLEAGLIVAVGVVEEHNVRGPHAVVGHTHRVNLG